jgi:2-oxoglutarate dehydrogenase E2 component (dihydrolipoamide succinyltransferase)
MSALFEVRAPSDESEGTRSQLLRWVKALGERVMANEPLVELETDKVTVEIPAPASGVLVQILKSAGEEVAAGDLLAQIELDEASAAAPQAQAPQRAPAAAGTAAAGASVPGGARDQLSPAVRRLMSEHGLTPEAVHGSGQAGRITAEDVLQAAHARQRAAAPAAEAKADALPSRRVPHSHMRKLIAEHMVQSLLRTAPHVTSVFEVDMSAVNAHRSKHRAEFEERGAALTLSAYFVAAIVDAIRVVPEANSRWSEDALEIYETINIGVAAAIEGGGLIVPGLRGVESRDLFDIARGLNDLVARARARELSPADLRGGTFTLSNHGTSGSLLAAPIVIHQPQAAILGVGKLEKRTAVIEEAGVERIVVRPKCYVTLTIDHRVLDGQDANRFLQTFVARLESWPLF